MTLQAQAAACSTAAPELCASMGCAASIAAATAPGSRGVGRATGVCEVDGGEAAHATASDSSLHGIQARLAHSAEASGTCMEMGSSSKASPVLEGMLSLHLQEGASEVLPLVRNAYETLA